MGIFKFMIIKVVQLVADHLYNLEKIGKPQLSKLRPLIHTFAYKLLVYSSKAYKIGGLSNFILML